MDVRECVRQATSMRERVEQYLAMGQEGSAHELISEFALRLVPGLTHGQSELKAWLGLLTRMIAPAAAIRDVAGGQAWLWPELAECGRRSAERSDESGARPDAPRRAGSGFVTQDPRMCRLLARVRQMAPTDLPILIEGESGTGKELLAQAVHDWSGRHAKASVAINCGAMPAQLQESELFGHARGAYTGATMEKPGLFEAAHEGTLFLDEVGEMDPRAQVKLLRVLESGELRRLGEVRSRQVNVRIVAATNADLNGAVDAGRFRKDLLYRLGAIRLRLTPLRQRRGDILPLAEYFLHRCLPLAPRLAPSARQALVRYDWPGNARELRFTMMRAVAMWEGNKTTEIGEDVLFPEDLCAYIGE